MRHEREFKVKNGVRAVLEIRDQFLEDMEKLWELAISVKRKNIRHA